MKHFALALGAAILTAGTAQADEGAVPPVTVTVEDSFDNVAFAVENAIIGKGLVVDHLSHTGDMLERTKKDVGATRTLYKHADIYSFCSATVSRQAMEANIENVQYCPYAIFLYERPEEPGKIVVGHANYPGASMAPVNKLLDDIIADAVGN